MSNVEKLLAKGAQIVGGDLILRHQVVGMFRYDDFILTPEGQAELEITDVEVKEVKKPRAKKAEETVAPTDDVTIEV